MNGSTGNAMYDSTESMVADVVHNVTKDDGLLTGVSLFFLSGSLALIFLVSSWWAIAIGVIVSIGCLFLLLGIAVQRGEVKVFKKYAPFYDRGDVFIDDIMKHTNLPFARIKEHLDMLVSQKKLNQVVIYRETGQIIIASISYRELAWNFLKYRPYYNNGEFLISDIEAKLNISAEAMRIELQDLMKFGAIETPVVDNAKNTIAIRTISPGTFQAQTKNNPTSPDPAPLPAKTGDKDVDEILQEGEVMLFELIRLRKSITDKQTQEKISEIINITKSIFTKLADTPAIYAQVTHFSNYYLPKSLKLLSSYEKLDSSSVRSENINSTLERLSKTLDSLVASFRKIYDSLYEHAIVDIEADIEAFEAMLVLDGFNADIAKDPDTNV